MTTLSPFDILPTFPPLLDQRLVSFHTNGDAVVDAEDGLVFRKPKSGLSWRLVGISVFSTLAIVHFVHLVLGLYKSMSL